MNRFVVIYARAQAAEPRSSCFTRVKPRWGGTIDLYVEVFVSENVLQGSSSSAVGARVLLNFGHMSSVISSNYDDKVGSFS